MFIFIINHILCMYKRILMSLCIIFSLALSVTEVKADVVDVGYIYPENSGSSHDGVAVFLGAKAVEFGDTLSARWSINMWDADMRNKRLQVFVVEKDSETGVEMFDNPSMYAYAGPCTNPREYPEGLRLVYETTISAYTRNSQLTGDFSFVVDESNGFSRNFIFDPENLESLRYGSPDRTREYLFARVVDAEFSKSRTSGCLISNRSVPFKVVSTKSYPDLYVERVSIEPSVVEEGGDVTMRFTVKNSGTAMPTGKEVFVCLDKRDMSLRLDSGVLLPIRDAAPRGIPYGYDPCITVKDIKAGASQEYVLRVDSGNKTLFAPTFSDMRTDNDRLVCGENKLALVVNDDLQVFRSPVLSTGMIEENYTNNETRFSLHISCGAARVENTGTSVTQPSAGSSTAPAVSTNKTSTESKALMRAKKRITLLDKQIVRTQTLVNAGKTRYQKRLVNLQKTKLKLMSKWNISNTQVSQ